MLSDSCILSRAAAYFNRQFPPAAPYAPDTISPFRMGRCPRREASTLGVHRSAGYRVGFPERLNKFRMPAGKRS